MPEDEKVTMEKEGADISSIEELQKLKDMSDLSSGLYNVLKTPGGNMLGDKVVEPDGQLSDYIIDPNKRPELDLDIIKEVMKGNQFTDNINPEDMQCLMALMLEYGPKIKEASRSEIYLKLPKSVRDTINIATYNPSANIGILKGIRYDLAKGLINDLVDAYNSICADHIDKLISEYTRETDKMQSDIGKIVSDSFSEIRDKTIANIDSYIEELRKDELNNRDKIAKLEKDKLFIVDEIIGLKSFKEFCSRCKIKRYDLERPEKLFKEFNFKYVDNHNQNIHDINICSRILGTHLKEHKDDDGITMLLIAFTKFCKNYKPDNILEHIFMDTFIKNIIYMDALAPAGVCILNADGSNKSEVDKYNKEINDLNECITSLLRRNKK